MQGLRFEPSEEQRRLVRAMAGFGVRQDDIAAHLEIDAKTLRRHFRRELDRGMVEANLKVAQSLFQMATNGKNVAAAIFWMKARAGWREKNDEASALERNLDQMSLGDLDRMIEFVRDHMGFEAEDQAAVQSMLDGSAVERG